MSERQKLESLAEYTTWLKSNREAREAEFDAADEAGKRVLIAQDVLEMLDGGEFRPDLWTEPECAS